MPRDGIALQRRPPGVRKLLVMSVTVVIPAYDEAAAVEGRTITLRDGLEAPRLNARERA